MWLRSCKEAAWLNCMPRTHGVIDLSTMGHTASQDTAHIHMSIPLVPSRPIEVESDFDVVQRQTGGGTIGNSSKRGAENSG